MEIVKTSILTILNDERLELITMRIQIAKIPVKLIQLAKTHNTARLTCSKQHGQPLPNPLLRPLAAC